MRWIVLALSLGATIVSLIHGVFVIWQLVSSGGSIMIDGSAFTWTTDVLLLMSAIIALVGGILAFTRRKIGGIFIVIAALLCLFAHPSTRIYGWVYLVAGVLAFTVRSSPEYYEEETDDSESEDEEEDDDTEEEARERGIFRPRAINDKHEDLGELAYGGKRKERERISRIKPDREEYGLSEARTPKISEPIRIRSSKVCPICGASVGIDHKFCYTCGSPLHATRVPDEPAGLTADIPTIDSEPAQDNTKRNVGFGKYSDDYEENLENLREETPQEEIEIDGAAPHRIFVKPSREDEEELERTFMINPDNSYQEFSNYTRRRKRRRNSLARRILGPMVLLLAVSGAAWLLLGTGKKPEPPIAIHEPEPEPEPESEFVPEQTIWEQIQIEGPTRGIVTGTNVNVRQNHSATGQVVTRLNAGTRADVLDRWEGNSGALSGPWFHIRSDGRDGWIYGQYFQPLDRRQATLPSGYTNALLKSFGSDRAELTALLGLPTRQTPTTMVWGGLTIDFRSGNDVVRLQITGTQHVLQNEIAVGITEETLYRKAGYPSDYRAGQLRYVESGAGNTEQGMAVRLQNGKVQSITVGNI